MTDNEFLDSAEEEIVAALRQYAEKASNRRGFRRRLFANDAARGFSFVDICRKRYDVVLMNPPFGSGTRCVQDYVAQKLFDAKDDLGMAFVARCSSFLGASGRLGAITTRVFVSNGTLEEWRRKYALGMCTGLREFADLGYGILDEALVEVAAYVVEHGTETHSPIAFHSVLDERDKEVSLLSLIVGRELPRRSFLIQRRLEDFVSLPGAVIAYQVPPSLLSAILSGHTLKALGGTALQGLITGDDFRFVRLVWEVPPESIGRDRRWTYYAKGGEYNPYWDDIHLVVNWANDGAEIRTFFGANGKLLSRPQNVSSYFRPGLTYPERTTSDFCPRAMPAETIFSAKGQAIFADSLEMLYGYLGGAFARGFKLLIEAFVGSGDASVPGSAAKDYRSGLLCDLPPPIWNRSGEVVEHVRKAVLLAASAFSNDETSRNFISPMAGSIFHSFKESALNLQRNRLSRALELLRINLEVETIAHEEMRISDSATLIDRIVGPHPCSYQPGSDVVVNDLLSLWSKSESALISEATTRHGARRQLTKKSYLADRRVELLAHSLEISPEWLVDKVMSANILPEEDLRASTHDIAQYCLGCICGRWDIRFANREFQSPELFDPLARLPVCPPGMLQRPDGLPAKPEDVPSNYPIHIVWDGILADDTEHEDDVVRCFRDALEVISKNHAEAIEKEACEILGVRELRDYFRKPGNGGFWMDHVRRYSKSRRNAPIYWYLRSARGNYGLWMYYHRLDKDILFKALLKYVEPKIRLEEDRLKTLRGRKEAAGSSGREAKQIEKDMDRQEQFVSELRDFADKLRRAANLHLDPDLNDGVILNIAPLWELAPWKEAKAYWEELVEGKYEWSNIGKQMLRRGLVKK